MSLALVKKQESKNIDEIYQTEFLHCIMLWLYRITFLCNVVRKLIIHQERRVRFFDEKVVKGCYNIY